MKVAIKYSLICFFTYLSFNVKASTTFDAEIHSISRGNPTLVKFTNGRVGFLDSSFDLNHSLLLSGRRVKANLSETNLLLSLQLQNTIEMSEGFKIRSSIEPTILASKEKVEEVFKRLKSTYRKDSECYNRAHIWSYEEYQHYGIVMEKAFVFFSDEYIRENNFHWWFHVAPYVLFVERNALFGAVMDHMFTERPISVKEWTDQWIVTKKPCREIDRYSEYSNNIYSNECFLIKVDMYFWQPRDLENQEKSGFQKTMFFGEEIQHAYHEAFNHDQNN
jgi:hypothetical protein